MTDLLFLFLRQIIRLAIFFMHAAILFGILLYLGTEQPLIDSIHQLGDHVDNWLIVLPNSYVAHWIFTKAPYEQGTWIINKGLPFVCFTCAEIYLHLIFFGYVRVQKPTSTSAKLEQNHGCALRFWLGLLNSVFSLVISSLFTMNSFLTLVNTQLGACILVCFICNILYFLTVWTFKRKGFSDDFFGPTIGVTLANASVLYFYLYGFSQYGRMLWLAQLVCVSVVCLLLVVLAVFNVKLSISAQYVKHISPTMADESKRQALMHKKYLTQYLTAINMPKLWLMATQLFQYTSGLWPADMRLIFDLAFFSICCLINAAFIPAAAYTQTCLYKTLPPVSFWLRFEISTIHYVKMLWACLKHYAKSNHGLWLTILHPYTCRNADNLKANAWLVLLETENLNNITYRTLTNITGIGFQILLAYYVMELHII